eukprot:7160925-Ditylum_brightwellii.AAC.1
MTGITLTNNDNKEDDLSLATAITGIIIANNTSNNPTVDDKEGKNERGKETIARGEKEEEKVEESNHANNEEETEKVREGAKQTRNSPGFLKETTTNQNLAPTHCLQIPVTQMITTRIFTRVEQTK